MRRLALTEAPERRVFEEAEIPFNVMLVLVRGQELSGAHPARPVHGGVGKEDKAARLLIPPLCREDSKGPPKKG
jgi:hypothetical protein